MHCENAVIFFVFRLMNLDTDPVVVSSDARSKLKDIMELDHFEVNETTFQLDAIMTSGLKLKFDTTRSVDSQLEALKKFLSDHPNEAEVYIDLRVEGKVFYQ